MYQIRRFHGQRLERLNAIIGELEGHISSFVNLIGSATLPFPEVCQMESLPGTACRVEGHLHARMFPSTEPVDEAERIIDQQMRHLFNLDETYLVSGQPHSATQANHAVLRAVLTKPDETVACLSITDGGHISHRFGAPDKTKFLPFNLTSSGIDYTALEKEISQRPTRLIVAGGTSYPLAIDYPRLRTIANQAGAHLHADLAHTAPFIAAGLHPPAFPFVDSATVDTNKNLRGPSGGVLVYREKDAAEIRRAIFPVLQSSPQPTVMMAKAACLTCWTHADLHAYATQMIHHASLLADSMASALGTPVFGGTETHLLLFDLTSIGMTGRDAEQALEKARVLVNRNQIPGDPNTPWIASGIRLGSTVPAILDYDDYDVRALGGAIGAILADRNDDTSTIDRLIERYHRPLINTASVPT